MYDLRVANGNQATPEKGPPNIGTGRGTHLWAENRRTNWKVANRFVNIKDTVAVQSASARSLNGKSRTISLTHANTAELHTRSKR